MTGPLHSLADHKRQYASVFKVPKLLQRVEAQGQQARGNTAVGALDTQGDRVVTHRQLRKPQERQALTPNQRALLATVLAPLRKIGGAA